MRVLKFGGSSLATPDRIRDVGRIVLNTVNGTPADRCRLRISGSHQPAPRLRTPGGAAGSRARTGISTGSQHAIVPRSRVSWTAHQRRRIRTLVDEQLGELRDALHGIRLLGHCPAGRPRRRGQLRRAPLGADRVCVSEPVPPHAIRRCPPVPDDGRTIHPRQRDLPEDESRGAGVLLVASGESPGAPSRSSPDSSAAPRTAGRRRSAGMDPTTRPPSSALRLARR